jgi:hypothetical protein
VVEYCFLDGDIFGRESAGVVDMGFVKVKVVGKCDIEMIEVKRGIAANGEVVKGGVLTKAAGKRRSGVANDN